MAKDVSARELWADYSRLAATVQQLEREARGKGERAVAAQAALPAANGEASTAMFYYNQAVQRESAVLNAVTVRRPKKEGWWKHA